MELNGFWPLFLAGCFGGALAELVKWFGLRESVNLPTYVRSGLYWVITALMVVCGGVLATLYGTQRVTAILGVNIGASAPLIMASLARTVPVPAGERTRGVPRQTSWSLLANFLSSR